MVEMSTSVSLKGNVLLSFRTVGVKCSNFHKSLVSWSNQRVYVLLCLLGPLRETPPDPPSGTSVVSSAEQHQHNQDYDGSQCNQTSSCQNEIQVGTDKQRKTLRSASTRCCLHWTFSGAPFRRYGGGAVVVI